MTVERAKETVVGVGRRWGSRVGERGLRARREEEEEGETVRRYEEREGKGREGADGWGWASSVAHNPGTPLNPV